MWWNGVQYLWQPGRYIERPAVSATYMPGHWEQQANGWVWVDGRWDYPGAGPAGTRQQHATGVSAREIEDLFGTK